MSAYAYKHPLPQEWRAEFEGLDLTGTNQRRIACSEGCGTGNTHTSVSDRQHHRLMTITNRIHGHESIRGCLHHGKRSCVWFHGSTYCVARPWRSERNPERMPVILRKLFSNSLGHSGAPHTTR